MTQPSQQPSAPAPASFPEFSRLKRSFQKDGYIAVDFGFPPALLEEAAAFMRRHWWGSEPHQKNTALYNGIRVQDAWKIDASVRSIALFQPVLDFLNRLYGKEPLPFQTLNFPVGTEQTIHSDVVHFNCWPNDGSLCGVWLALEDIDEDNGPLVYYPGSHLLPEVYPSNFGLPSGPAAYPAYEKKLADLVQYLELTPEKTFLRKGTAFIWAANLLHGGGWVRDKSRTRMTQVTHYFFEGSEFYWTPLLSDIPRGHVERRHPEFIGAGSKPGGFPKRKITSVLKNFSPSGWK